MKYKIFRPSGPIKDHIFSTKEDAEKFIKENGWNDCIISKIVASSSFLPIIE